MCICCESTNCRPYTIATISISRYLVKNIGILDFSPYRPALISKYLCFLGGSEHAGGAKCVHRDKNTRYTLSGERNTFKVLMFKIHRSKIVAKCLCSVSLCRVMMFYFFSSDLKQCVKGESSTSLVPAP